ncbi:alpha/beta hydrolase [Leucobacter musarum]|uniref:alpha/beta hydrolase n=1 Tax=Leucobacter musarum TaxID=1930747 RepID=UPI0006A77415|nr:alpha/beta hydrolase [Leucobacter musarum]
MTIFVPTGPDAVLDGTPIVGAPEEAAALGRYASAIADGANRYGLSVRQAHVALSTAQSKSLDQLSAKLAGRLIPGSNAMRESAEHGRRACSTYASEIDRIHSAARGVRSTVAESLDTIRRCAHDIGDIASAIRISARYAWDEGAPGAMPTPVLGPNADALSADQREAAVQSLSSMYAQQWLLAAAEWRSSIESIRDAARRWRDLIEERSAIEKSFAGALGATTLGQLISVGGAGSSRQIDAISAAVAGEYRGVAATEAAVRTAHPLLAQLLGTESGSLIWDAPANSADVAQRWAAMSEADKNRLIAEVPWVIGNLPGLPYGVRDATNRKLVEFYREHSSMLSPDQLRLVADVSRILDDEAEQIKDRGSARPPIQMVAFDMSTSVPRAAVGYGDLDTADVATWEVPGMNSDASMALESWDQSSRNLYRKQGEELGGDAPRAVVAWLGYDTPDGVDTFQVLLPEVARQGAARLALELDGMPDARVTQGSGMPVISVVAHSYGTTVSSIALTLVKYPVDSFIMLGSAGLDTATVRTLDDLNVQEITPGQRAIYTTHASQDELAPAGAGLAGRGQPNPDARAPWLLPVHTASPVYDGALSFSSEGDEKRNLLPTDGHSTIGSGDRRGFFGVSASRDHGYMDLQTESLANVAEISTGHVSDQLMRSLTRSESACVEVPMFHGEVRLPRRVDCEVT